MSSLPWDLSGRSMLQERQCVIEERSSPYAQVGGDGVICTPLQLIAKMKAKLSLFLQGRARCFC